MAQTQLLSPGVQINQYNLTQTVPQIPSSNCGMIIRANTGYANTIIPLTQETDLVNNFGYPDNSNYKDWFNAWNFLQYSSSLYAIRPMATTATNAGVVITGGSIVGTSPEPSIIEGLSLANMYNTTLAEGVISSTAINGGISFFNKFVTSNQNLAVAVCSSPSGWNLPVSSDTTLVFDPTIQNTQTLSILPFSSFFKKPPVWSQGQYAIIVFQQNPTYNNLYSKVETWIVSNSPTAMDTSGNNMFVNNIFLYQSQYLYAILGSNNPNPVETQGNDLIKININQDTDVYPSAGSLATGNLTYTGIYLQSDIENAEAIFQDKKDEYPMDIFVAHELDINGFPNISVETLSSFSVVPVYNSEDLVGQSGSQIAQWIANNYGTQSDNLNMIFNSFSTYAGVFGNMKYQYDKFNNVNRWVSVGGDIAGLMASTDATYGVWYAAAGYNRGSILNVIKLLYSPNLALRNLLYQNGINSIINVPGEGAAIVWGQATATATASALDRIPVQRMFILIEQSISKLLMGFVEEFNNSFTRHRIINAITPFLQNIKSLQGLYDFKLVCDSSNNPPAIEDMNELIVDIYLKPTMLAEFIHLNVYAVPTGVTWSQVGA